MRLKLAALAAMLFCLPALATTYHVALSGSDSNPGTLPLPFLTPQKCVNTMVAGDTCLLHGPATYSSSTTNADGRTAIISAVLRNGTSGARFTIKGAGDGVVTLSGSSQYAIYLRNSDFWTVGGTGVNEGFTVGSFPTDSAILSGPISNLYGTNVKILGNNLTGTTSTNNSSDAGEIMVFYGQGALNAEVAYNTITVKAMETGIMLGQGGTCVPGHGCYETAAEVHHNTIIGDASRRHILLRAKGVGDLHYHDNYVQEGNGTTGQTTPSDSMGILLRNCQTSIVYNNYVHTYGNTAAPAIYLYDESSVDGPNSNDAHKVYNNTVNAWAQVGIRMDRCTNCDARNNAVMGYDASHQLDRGILCNDTASTAAENTMTLGFNSGFNSTGEVYGFTGTSGGRGPCATACASTATCQGGDLLSNPLIVGSGAMPVPRFRLQASSPLIDVGCDRTGGNGSIPDCLSAPSADYDGETRSSPRPDIGADEQAAAAGDSTPPAAVTNLAATIVGITAPQLHVKLTWTAPGDDGSVGTASTYNIRWATTPITNDGEFNVASAVSFGLDSSGILRTTEPAPNVAGTSESFTVIGLAPNTTYYFAIKTLDEVANTSPLSTVNPSATTAKYEGGGYQSVGGGGLGFCNVTNLNDSGAGSFRSCVGPSRNIVFSVGGTITLATRINFRGTDGLNGDHLTIDGSTAPSPGITFTHLPGSLALPRDDDWFRVGDLTHFIMSYVRFQGLFAFDDDNGSGSTTNNDIKYSRDDLFTTNNLTSAGTTQHLVLDHITIRDAADAGMDLFDRTDDVTVSNCLFLHNAHPMTSGSDAPSNRVSLYRNLWIHNGERQPQLIGLRRDFDIRNNIHFDWAYNPNPGADADGDGSVYTQGAYAIRIRNNTPGTPPGDVTANIINNIFMTTNSASGALTYASVPGGRGADSSEENGPTTCQPQLSDGTSVLFSTSAMNSLYVSGNIFPSSICDAYSTVASALTVPAAQAITTLPASSLPPIVLPGAGTLYRLADEQAAVDEVTAALGGGGVSIGGCEGCSCNGCGVN